MSYIVKSQFIENGHLFKVGDLYPLDEQAVDDERIKHLLSPFAHNDFSFIEKCEEKKDDESPFKGVRETQLRKLAKEKEIEVPEEVTREEIIELLLNAGITSL
ncbi:hypothetical protein IW492_02685 [Enterococcus sp. BWB1-3]|uniref:hypothetical protein n=1 Tax=Enterococcus sp. BWB1-3 TaxID=2787713 RepID=UPI0019210AA2|nr:hypothetical protein [Enterococcus sp. BWB1-3]MBL1228138.1 hypothetical protein [Enterococcus sp. BWB1-3]